MAVKRRVFQVAKEFNVSNEALIAFLSKHDYTVKNHMSPVSEDMYQELQKKYKPEAVGPTDTDDSFRRRLREKKQEDEKRKERQRREVEERIRIAQELATKPISQRKKEPSKAEVLKIAEADAKAQAKAELRTSGWGPKDRGGVIHGNDEMPEVEEETRETPEPRDTAPPSREEAPAQPPEAKSEPQPEVSAKTGEEPGVKPTTPPAKEPPKGKAKKPAREAEKPKAPADVNGKVEGKSETTEAPKKKKRRKKKKRKISEEEIEASIK